MVAYAKHYQSGGADAWALRDGQHVAMRQPSIKVRHERAVGCCVTRYAVAPPTSALPEEVDAFEQLVLQKRTWIWRSPALSQQLFLPYLRRRLCGEAITTPYLWTQMLADDGYQWFVEQSGLTRENGQRFREAILSRGNSAVVNCIASGADTIRRLSRC
ncbi:M3 family metallopeptidase [Klebsiella pneumoniae]|nr:M3 family metallopeptidase [Klebsiella pneumoniae]